jgi:hypothetical protein
MRTAVVALGSVLWSGLFSSASRAEEKWVDAIQANQEIPESQLLDVGIRIFDTGIPDDEFERYILEEKGVFEDVRRAEARYFPMLLKRTLESTGYWGAVRLVPDANSVDLTLTGAIVNSNGKKLEVDLEAIDSTGKRWFNRRYEAEADVLAYDEKESGREPFQILYNRIANDLLKERNELDEENFAAIHRMSELRFATDLAPTRFEGYLSEKKGRYTAVKLPADADPVMVRVGQIRERDHMFIDTLNEYYADLFTKMEKPYGSWRSFSYEEQLALDKLNNQSKWETILGAAAIAGSIFASRRGGAWSRVGQVGVYGGMAAIMDGLDKREQAKMHREALNELAGSFDSEVSELLIDVEGEVLRLKGSVETQYASWRELLRQIFDAQTALPIDPNELPLPGSIKGTKQ